MIVRRQTTSIPRLSQLASFAGVPGAGLSVGYDEKRALHDDNGSSVGKAVIMKRRADESQYLWMTTSIYDDSLLVADGSRSTEYHEEENLHNPKAYKTNAAPASRVFSPSAEMGAVIAEFLFFLRLVVCLGFFGGILGQQVGHKIGGMSGLEPGSSGSESRTLPLRHTTPQISLVIQSRLKTVNAISLHNCTSDGSFNSSSLEQYESSCSLDPCGTGRPLVMQGYTGTFSSPNYPQNYPAKRTCSWRVKSDARGRQLWLVFDDRFSIEHYKKCEYDYLKIYDGPDENAPLVKTLCDEEAPPPVNLTGNDAFVKFKSDQAITKTGFRITWRTCPPNMLLCDVGSVCLRPENRCDMTQNCQDWTDELNCVYGQQNACGGQVLADGPGNITTLNYPVFFPPGLSCTWNIVAAPGKRLRASFTGIFDVPCLTAVKVREVGPTRNKPNKANGISTFCGRRTPSDIIVTEKERLRVQFQPPMVIPGKGFALTWETSCQENYFSCPEGSCLVPEKVCDGTDDCQQGEDESYPACPTTAPPTSTPIVTTGNDGKPESETALTSNTLASNTLASNTLASNTLASNTVTPGKWSTDHHTASQTGPIREKTIPSATSTTQHGLIHTSTVQEGIPKASSVTPQAWTNMTVTWAWNGTLGGSTSLTTQSLDTYPKRQCYSCHDDGACASPVDSAVPVTECLDDQACWVERILGPGKQKERIVYRRGCGSLCPEYWEQEDCMDGWVQTCRLCCAEDLCNSQLLNGDDKRFSNQVSESGMAEAPEPNWIHLLVAALSAVGIFTA
ncbi:hypothetical protein Bbelb_293560 [Branchiostoma belcheri]|nr:hypothetical protein Bbelb_293560 [Branchiostoma belcheri]